ncbi:hypothetical protein E2542_SST16658 [Spatholobus suberectus]|nr:hypothetical protein E2542_SST16658 [Spatholobus suberectus]
MILYDKVSIHITIGELPCVRLKFLLKTQYSLSSKCTWFLLLFLSPPPPLFFSFSPQCMDFRQLIELVGELKLKTAGVINLCTKFGYKWFAKMDLRFRSLFILN